MIFMTTEDILLKEIISLREKKDEGNFDKISLRVYALCSFFGMSQKEVCQKTGMKMCTAYYCRGHYLFGY